MLLRNCYRFLFTLLVIPWMGTGGIANAQEFVFGSVEWLPASLEGKVYQLPPNTHNLPDFSKLASISKVYTSNLNIPERAWSEGFPGVKGINEWFGVDYHGFFQVTQQGRYTFRLSSDDGSKLLINEQLIINHDGTHGTSSRSGSIELQTGMHKINIQYFQGPRYHIALQLFVIYENSSESLFPGDKLTLETPPEIRFVRPTKGGYQLMHDVEYDEAFFVEVYYEMAPKVKQKKVQLSFSPTSESVEIDIFQTEEDKYLFRSKPLSLME